MARKVEVDGNDYYVIRETDIIGNKVRARVVKNKVAPPFKKAELEILYKSGISKEGGIIDLGVELDILTKNGSFYSFGEKKIGQGREAVRKFLVENETIRDSIEKDIIKSFNISE